MAVSPSSQSLNPPPIPPGNNTAPRSTISVVFVQGGSTCLLRPNTVVRGHVELKLIKPCYAAGIRLRLRAEESAIVLGQESNGDSIRQKYHQTVITLFDTEVMVSGSNQNDNELSNWQEIPIGSHIYPFALKVPNVNFPPCIPSLDGFSIRYVWTAHVDGPFEASLSSEEILCQFTPNVLAPKPMEWTYHDVVGAVVSKSSTHQLHKQPMGIAVAIKMHQQIYVPGDPLSMATTLVNNGQNKIVGLDVILRRTIKGTFATSYANLCNQAQVEIMSKAVDCKVRPGESNQVDILTTIPPMEAYSIPTFESNFLKVYYELLCVIRVKRSVFAGGDTSYQCVIPIPIATHNIDNPMITGRTPRWTKSRMQPYFFEPTWADPVGDLHAPVTNDNDTINNTSSVTSPGDTPTGIQSPASASTASLLGSPGASSSAMHEFLNSGSAELHRERTLKKSLTRSKSLKDIQSARLNGSSWRAERDQLLSQSREAGSVESSGTSKRSPPLGPKSRSSNEDKQAPSGPSPAMDSNGNVAYTPPPPSTSRSQRNASNNLTPEQQAELARKASRRILPNQGMYTNEGTLPPDYTVNKTQSQATGSYANGHNNNTEGESGQHQVSNGSSSNNASFPVPSSNANSNANSSTNPINKIPPRRNASLSQKAHQQLQQLQQQSSAGSYGNGNLVAEPDSIESHSRGGSSMGYSTNAHNDSNHLSRGRSNNGSSDQGQHRSGQEQPYSSAALERIPYQHSLPAHQQPPGVVSPTLTASPPYASMAASGTNCQLERSPSRRDGVVAGDILPPPPPFNKAASSGTLTEEGGRHHRRTGSNASANGTASASLTKIPPWERVERIHHQDWFRPGPHQSGALQTFDVAGLTLSQQQAVPILKKSLQRPMETVQSIEVEEHLR